MTGQNDYNRQLIEEFRADRSKSAHPDWYYNLVAHPEVTVEVGTETYDATAVVTQGAERDRLWTSIVDKYPFFTEHQAKITRQIPVIALSRRKQ